MRDLLECINLLGYSIKYDRLNQLMTEYSLEKSGKSSLDVDKNILNARYKSSNGGLLLSFRGYRRYVFDYGEPIYITDKNKDELILVEIDILEDYLSSSISDELHLPFDLELGDNKDSIIRKLNRKPSVKTNLDNGGNYKYAWWFTFDNFRLLTALNSNYELLWVRIILLELSEKKRIELKKSLSRENKNIKPENKESILSFINELPTVNWRARMNDGDSIFTEKSIDEVEILLKDFVNKVADFTDKKNASGIYGAVKKLVLFLNKLNVTHKYFIETLEREGLCIFISDIVNKAGLFPNSNIDITEEWRMW